MLDKKVLKMTENKIKSYEDDLSNLDLKKIKVGKRISCSSKNLTLYLVSSFEHLLYVDLNQIKSLLYILRILIYNLFSINTEQKQYVL